jgi:hypothetical protein
MTPIEKARAAGAKADAHPAYRWLFEAKGKKPSIAAMREAGALHAEALRLHEAAGNPDDEAFRYHEKTSALYGRAEQESDDEDQNWTGRNSKPTSDLGASMETEHYVPHGRGVLPPAVLSRVKTKQIGSIGGYRVFDVDGALIRNEIHIDFTTGGNPGRYAYVPEGELWVERVLEPKDMAASLLHEAVESILMERVGMDYDAAHERASRAEVPFRAWMRENIGRVGRRNAVVLAGRWLASAAAGR